MAHQRSGGLAVLAYSGGLDTSVSIPYIKEKYGLPVAAVTVDLGQQEDLEPIKAKALKIGATSAHIIDARNEFATQYIMPAIKANLLYEGVYPAGTSMARPLIVEKVVAVAKELGATHLAHGCTGKGNDQVRFEATAAILAPHLRILAPIRDWGVSRAEEIAYAKKHGVPVPVTAKNPFSIDENLWGRSVEAGILEDPGVEPPEEVYAWTTSPAKAPDKAQVITIGFQKGVPVSLNGKELDPVTLIQELNTIAGRHGVGRIDHLENRLVGIKSREIYEYPAATVLILAHKGLEKMVLIKDVARFKTHAEQEYADLAYNGLWFSPLKLALDAFIDKTQETATGEVRVKLFKGSATVVGLTSPYSLYDTDLATYGAKDAFQHGAAAGFISIFALPYRVAASVQKPDENPGPTNGDGQAPHQSEGPTKEEGQ